MPLDMISFSLLQWRIRLHDYHNLFKQVKLVQITWERMKISSIHNRIWVKSFFYFLAFSYGRNPFDFADISLIWMRLIDDTLVELWFLFSMEIKSKMLIYKLYELYVYRFRREWLIWNHHLMIWKRQFA